MPPLGARPRRSPGQRRLPSGRPGGPAGALKAAGILQRNYPLVLLLVLIGTLFWPTQSEEQKNEIDSPDELQPADIPIELSSVTVRNTPPPPGSS